MASYRYLHLDVFTLTRLEGNQLAVVFGGEDLDSGTMQAVALEMAFSETVFVLQPVTPDSVARLRIFTPAHELPMAGHPTIGATFALAYERQIGPSLAEIVLGLGIGPTRVGLEWSGSELSFAWMSQQVPRFGSVVPDVTAIGELVGMSPQDIAPGLPVQSVSCGLPYLFVPLVSRAAVDRSQVDARSLSAFCRQTGVDEQGVFVFALDADDPDVTAYSRMFAPTFGVAEDPATGSASGPLGCYLVRHGAVPSSAQDRMVSLQGVKMKRPSRITIAIDGTADRITGVRIGGTSVLVAAGQLFL